jgi:hypothetical protein
MEMPDDRRIRPELGDRCVLRRQVMEMEDIGVVEVAGVEQITPGCREVVRQGG